MMPTLLMKGELKYIFLMGRVLPSRYRQKGVIGGYVIVEEKKKTSSTYARRPEVLKELASSVNNKVIPVRDLPLTKKRKESEGGFE